MIMVRMMWSEVHSMGNLRDKKGKFTSRKQLANQIEDQFHVVGFFLS